MGSLQISLRRGSITNVVRIKVRIMPMEKSKKIHANLAKMDAKDAEEKSKRSGPKEAEKPQNVPVAKRKS